MTGPAEHADGPGVVDPAPLASARVRTEPVVLRLQARRGWAEADLGRRGFAVLLFVLLAVWLVIAPMPDPTEVGRDGVAGTDDDFQVLIEVPAWVLWWNLGYLLLGPPACYSLARILRPYPNGPRGERPWRHWGAAAGTAYGLVVLLMMQDTATAAIHGQVGALYLSVAVLLAPLTSAWGVIAMVTRRRRRRRP